MGQSSPERVSTPTGAVFLSYASQDVESAQKMCEALRAAGIEVWFDQSELRGGEAWDRHISKEIKECALFVPVISAHSDERSEGYFRREWRVAVDRMRDMADDRTFLLPVVIDSTREYTARVPDRFREFQWLRLPGGETATSAVDHIRRLLSATGHTGPTRQAIASGSGAQSVHDVQGTQGRYGRSWWLPTLLALGVLVVAGGVYLAFERLTGLKRSAPITTAADKSIAVLPFADLSEKHDQEYFADGLAEEVLSLLATLPELRVISRTSSFQFKGQNIDLRTVGARLGASYIVEGSVRRSADRVRVTAQLINSIDGSQRWSEGYDETIDDVLRMQQAIAAALGRALEVEVKDASGQPARSLANTDAYTTYLRGLHAMDRYDNTGIAAAISYFERALTLDPTLLRAREKLAQAYYVQLELGLVNPAISAPRLRQTLDTVLQEDPHSVMGHALRAEQLVTYDWSWTEAQREAEQAVTLGKNSSFALYAAADIAGVLGHRERAEAAFRESLAIDPLDADTHDLFCWELLHAGRFVEAEAEARRIVEIRPTYASAHFDVGLALMGQGKFEAALAEMQNETATGPRFIGLAMALHALKRRAESDAALRAAEREVGDDWAYQIACAHAYRGEIDEAFRWLERAYRQKDFMLEYLKGEWALKSLEGDPRYKAFLRKMNLPG